MKTDRGGTIVMVLDASKFIPGDAKDKLPEFYDRCIDLVVTAPPGYREKGNDMSGDTSYSWDTFDDGVSLKMGR